MLKFFRNIRRKLISEGKLRRYLVYALGEILLVVIGILIALQVNNWNQVQKGEKVEAELLLALNEEFSYNLEVMDAEMALLNSVKAAMINILGYTGPGFDQVSKEKFGQLISDAGKDELEYYPSVGVIQDIINAGQLSNISNIELRRKLAAWDSKLERINNQERIVEAYRENIKKITMQYGNMVDLFIDVGLPEFKELEASRFKTDPRKMLALQELENVIAYKIAATNTLESHYQDLQKEITEILALLEKEIKN